MPEFKRLETTAECTLAEESLQRFRQRLAAIAGYDEADGGAKKGLTLKEKYLANRHNLMALDHAVQRGLSLAGLADFMRELALRSNETRYMVDLAELDEEIRAAPPGRKQRVCICGDGEPELECIWGDNRKALFIHCDRGSIGWPAKVFLFSSACGLRGDVIPDVSHRRNNGYLNAWHRSGLSVCKVELGVIFNLMRGPFHGCANFHNITQAALQFYGSETWGNPLFLHCYEVIVRDRCKGIEPPDFGTTAHMQATWASLRDSGLLVGKGPRMKLSRWFSWGQRARAIQPYLGELLLVLLYIGVFEGWYTSLEDALFGSTGADQQSTLR